MRWLQFGRSLHYRDTRTTPTAPLRTLCPPYTTLLHTYPAHTIFPPSLLRYYLPRLHRSVCCSGYGPAPHGAVTFTFVWWCHTSHSTRTSILLFVHVLIYILFVCDLRVYVVPSSPFTGSLPLIRSLPIYRCHILLVHLTRYRFPFTVRYTTFLPAFTDLFVHRTLLPHRSTWWCDCYVDSLHVTITDLLIG